MSLAGLIKFIQKYLELEPSKELLYLFAQVLAVKLTESENLLQYATSDDFIDTLTKLLKYQDLCSYLKDELIAQCAPLL